MTNRSKLFKVIAIVLMLVDGVLTRGHKGGRMRSSGSGSTGGSTFYEVSDTWLMVVGILVGVFGSLCLLYAACRDFYEDRQDF